MEGRKPLAAATRDTRGALRLLAFSVALVLAMTSLLLAWMPVLPGGAVADPSRVEVETAGHRIPLLAPINVMDRERVFDTITAKDIAEPEYLDPAKARRIDLALRSPGAKLQYSDASRQPVAIPSQGHPGGIASLTAETWLHLLVVAIGALAGGSVLVMRPTSPSARLFAVLGALLYLSGVHFSALRHADIATPLVLRDFIVRSDLVLIGPFAFGWLCLFLRFPAPLISGRQLFALMAAGSAAFVALAFTSRVDRMAHAQIGIYVAMLVVLLVQYRVSRRDLSERRAMRVIGASVGVGTLLYILASLVPMATGEAVPINEVVTMPLFVSIYCGIGVAILRNRRIVIDGWLRSIVVAICLACLALLTELAIVPLFGAAKDAARVAAFVAILAAYIPFRHFLVQKHRRARDAAFRRAFRKAAEVAFEDEASGRALRWRSAISAIFRPIEMEVEQDGSGVPEIDEGGLALRIPRFEDAPPLRLRYAQDGARIFDEDDVDTVGAMIEIVEGLIRSRSAYARGVSEERERIARDLHDDVSARLLSGLHREELGAMKSDIREAMGDIRAIVNGLVVSGETLGSLLADIRHESSSRLQSAGIDLNWSIDDILESSLPITPTIYRHVSSIFRETFSNVIRHSGATAVHVSCKLDHSWLSAIIADNGRGLENRSAIQGRGVGNCENRAQLLNGYYRLCSTHIGVGSRAEIVVDICGS